MCGVTLKITVGACAQGLEDLMRVQPLNLGNSSKLLGAASNYLPTRDLTPSASAIMAVLSPIDCLLFYGSSTSKRASNSNLSCHRPAEHVFFFHQDGDGVVPFQHETDREQEDLLTTRIETSFDSLRS